MIRPIDARFARSKPSSGPGRLARWRSGLAVAVCLAVLAVGGSAEAAAKKKEGEPKSRPRLDAEGIYAMTMTRGEGGLHIVEYWSKPGQLRAHTTIAGHPFVTLVSAETYYTLDPVFKRGVAIARSDRAKAADRGRRRLFGNEFEDMLAAGAERVRTEDTPGGPLEVYRLTDDGGRRTVWVTADEYRLPLKFKTFDRRTGSEAEFEYLDWSPLRLPEKFFEAPESGWEIERVESYDAWLKAPRTEAFKQAPIIFPLLLHGRP